MARLSRFPDSAILVFFILIACLLRLAMLSAYPIPLPVIHDEYANMLGAETFALGRLTNPPSLFPNSLFEFMVVDAHSRTMIYPPAMAAFMALGIVVFGHAYWGVVLCMALAISAIYWMLRGWVNKETAFIATFFCLLLFRAPHYWMNSYWGASPALLAGCIILGAYARIVRKQQFRMIPIAAIGMALAFFSRPFEVLLLALCLAIHGFILFLRYTAATKKHFLMATIPALPIIAAALAFQLYYNATVTGDMLLFPYAFYIDHYTTASSFTFGALTEANASAHYGLQNIQKTELYSMGLKQHRFLIMYVDTLSNLLQLERFGRWANLFSPPAIACLIVIPLTFLSKKMPHAGRPLAFAWSILLVAYFLTAGVWPHYLVAQFAVTLVLLSIFWESRHASHRLLSFGVMATIVLCLTFLDGERLGGNKAGAGLFERYASALPPSGQHLVLVDNRAQAKLHPIHSSMIHNPPDIENARVIWAWHLSPQENRALIAHYKNRRLWYVDPLKQPAPIPYHE